MAAYATREDVYRRGIPRGALTSPARLVSSASASTDRLELDGHGFSDAQPVQFRVVDSGALPAPLAEGTVYYVKTVTDSDSLFQVSATAGGAAVNLTTAGTAPFLVFAPLHEQLDAALTRVRYWLDAALQSCGAPFDSPYPDIVVDANARLAGVDVLISNDISGFDGLKAAADNLRKDLLRMGATGIPLRDARALAHTNVAVVQSSDNITSRTDMLP